MLVLGENFCINLQKIKIQHSTWKVNMESIAKYFESSKKRDLSDGSKTSEEPKNT